MDERMPKYAPEIFLQNTIEDAKQIILMPEVGLTTDERWERETDWLLPHLKFPNGLVIDYGCGIGRMAKVLDNPVLGVDISPPMRALAQDYVAKVDFGVTQPYFLRHLVHHGLEAIGAIAFWCLQHCVQPEQDIELLHEALEPGAALWVLNAPRRYVPAVDADGKFFWAEDGRNIDAILFDVGFTYGENIPMPTDLCQEGCYLKQWIK